MNKAIFHNRSLSLFLMFCLSLVFLAYGELFAQYQLKSYVISSVGKPISGSGYNLFSTGGQSQPIENSFNSTYSLYPGFINRCVAVTGDDIMISGRIFDLNNVGFAGIAIEFSNQGGTVSTDSTGGFFITLPYNWSGTITPILAGYEFEPPSRFLPAVRSNLSEQYFTGWLAGGPAAPTNLRELGDTVPAETCAGAFGNAIDGEVTVHGTLKWDDNSSDEEYFSIRISLPNDTLSPFLEVGQAPRDCTTFSLNTLEFNSLYKFRVTAVNSAMIESGPSDWTECTDQAGGNSFPTEAFATPRSNNSILITWKDNTDDEFFYLVNRIVSETDNIITIPANSRYYLDTGIDSNVVYTYEIATANENGDQVSDWSNATNAQPRTLNSLIQHSNGLEIDNQGGGADGWSHFPGSSTRLGLIYDGHFQVWAGDTIVYDGDDGDFVHLNNIRLYPANAEKLFEHSADANDANEPVKFQSFDGKISIEQFTYQIPGENWVVADWVIQNTGSNPATIKTGLFFDGDAGNNISSQDIGGFDETRNLVYMANLDVDFAGIALFDQSKFINFQVNHFRDYKTPDRVLFSDDICCDDIPIGGGEIARLNLFNENPSYFGILQSPRYPADIAITLLGRLGNLNPGESNRIFYIIARGGLETDFEMAVDNANLFIQNFLLTGLDNPTTSDELVKNFDLLSVYPNPFNPVTTLTYQIPRRSRVEIKVFNVSGQEVRRLVNRELPSGKHEVQWDSRNNFGNLVASGIYFATMTSENFAKTVKMILIR